jgi:hypothetical protein
MQVMRLGQSPFRSRSHPRAHLVHRGGAAAESDVTPVQVAAIQPHDDATVAEVMTLDEAIAALSPYMGDSIVPTGYLINPLLDVWSAAHAIGPTVARPVEELLTVFISRSTTTPAELVATFDLVRIAALQANMLAHA